MNKVIISVNGRKREAESDLNNSNSVGDADWRRENV